MCGGWLTETPAYEPRQVNDASDRVAAEDRVEQVPVEDAALVEGDGIRYEVSVAAGEIIEDHGLDAVFHERLRHASRCSPRRR